MNANPFQTAELHYAHLVEQYRRGQIPPTDFAAQVAALGVRDAEGRAWQISPETGRWMVWDGAAWRESPPPHAARSGVGTDLARSVAAGARGAVRATPGMLIGYIAARIIPIGITVVGAWLAHTYLLVFKNDGFNPDTEISKWINVTGNSTSALAIWGIGSAVFWSFVYSVFRVGPVRAVSGLFSAPFQFLGMLGRGGSRELGGLATGAGLALFLAARFGLNTQASLCLGFGLTLFGAGYPGVLLSSFLTGTISSFSQRRSGGASHLAGAMRFVAAGIGPGVLLAGLLSAGIAAPASLGLVALGAFLLFSGGKKAVTPASLAAFLLVATAAVAMLYLVRTLFSAVAHADDGGASECGKEDFATYLRDHEDCAGSDEAMSNGYGPAAGAGAGAGTPPLSQYQYSISLQVTPNRLKIDGKSGVWASAQVVTNDPKANAFALTSEIEFGTDGECGDWLQMSPPQMNGPVKTVYLTATAPGDAAPGDYAAAIVAAVASPTGPIFDSAQLTLELAPSFVLELF